MEASRDDALSDAANASWSRYWSTGIGHSCGGSFDPQGSYGGEIAAFWAASFADLAPDSKTLDIATGNGAVPRLWLQAGPDMAAHCVGVDAADIRVDWHERLPAADKARLHFIGGVHAEALPFADDSFDQVVSQYGLEYADPVQAMTQVLRVLSAEGRLDMVIHHPDSRPVNLAHEELSHLAWIQAHDGWLDSVAQMLEPVSRSVTPEGRDALRRDAVANAARDHHASLQVSLHKRAAEMPLCPDVLHETAQAGSAALMLAMQRNAAVAWQAWQSHRQALADARVRLHALVARAPTEATFAALISQIETDGRRVRTGLLKVGAHMMGRTLQAGPRF